MTSPGTFQPLILAAETSFSSTFCFPPNTDIHRPDKLSRASLAILTNFASMAFAKGIASLGILRIADSRQPVSS
jgi:hypothetical protein